MTMLYAPLALVSSPIAILLFSLLALEFLPIAMPLSLAKAVPLSSVLSEVLPIATPASAVLMLHNTNAPPNTAFSELRLCFFMCFS